MSDPVLQLKTEPLSGLRSRWPALFKKILRKNPFLSYEWFGNLSRALLDDDPEVFTFYHNDDLIAIA